MSGAASRAGGPRGGGREGISPLGLGQTGMIIWIEGWVVNQERNSRFLLFVEVLSYQVTMNTYSLLLGKCKDTFLSVSGQPVNT